MKDTTRTKKATKKVTAKKPAARSPNSPPREGDVFAIQLDQGGFAFAHVLKIHRDPPHYGPFIRVFQTVKSDPAWDDAIAHSGERFRIFFPVSYAQRAKLATRVASIGVPEIDRIWPVFKSYNDKHGSDERTWFKDDWASKPPYTGKPRDFETVLADIKANKLGHKLPRALLDAPMAQVVNLTALCHRIATNWTHRTEVRPQDLEE